MDASTVKIPACIRFDRSVLDRLDAIAEALGRSRAWVISEVIVGWLDGRTPARPASAAMDAHLAEHRRMCGFTQEDCP